MGNLAGWPYWKVASITGQSGASIDYQVELDIGDSAGGDFHLEGHCTNFPQDIRITDNDGTTLLDHWVEDLTADPIVVHVEVKDDLGSNQTIRVYYGKNGETTASNGAATFEFIEDVEDNDLSDWTTEAGATFTSVGSPVKHGSYAGDMENTIDYAEAYKSVGTNLDDRIFEFDARVPQNTENKHVNIEKTGGDMLNSVYLFFRTTNNIDYYDGSFHTLQAYSINTWYHFKITTHPAADTFDIEIDDVDKGSGLGTRGSIVGGINAISFMGTSGGHFYVDSIFMRRYNSPEPAFSSAGAEQSPGVPILTRLTTKGETIITLTIDERGNRVISNIITEYGDTVFSESRSYSDTLTIGDVKSYGILKVVTNVIGVLDTFSKTIVVTKAFTEIANVSDVIQNNMSRVLSNTISINDTLILLRKRILSEIISIADTLGSFNITKVISNSFAGFVDTVTRGFNVRILLETANVNDVVEKGIVRRAFGDAIGVVDTIIVTPIKSCIEAIGVTDTLGAFSISKVIAEITNIIDARVSSITKTPFNEEVSNTDIVSKTPIKRVDIEDITLSDVNVVKDVNHIESESIIITESTTRFISMIVTEVCSIVDDISNTVLFIRTFAESITISDAISNVRKFFYEKRSKITNKLLQSSIVNKLLRSKVEGIKNSEVEQYED